MAGLGINKDLEPLARRVRREGGSVDVTRANHVEWHMPDGSLIRTGLTMNATTARRKQREIEDCLAGADSQPSGGLVAEPDGRGKFRALDPVAGAYVCNASGYPRTFATARDAQRATPPR